MTDGVVTVQRVGEPEIYLTAGTRWASIVVAAPSSTAPANSSEMHLDTPRAPKASLDVSGAERAIVATDAHRASSLAQTRLAEQNRLFADAMTARERGNSVEAVQKLERFRIRQFPVSPLIEDAAHVELFRAFAQAGDRSKQALARVARQYLYALHADGFARDEAREAHRCSHGWSPTSIRLRPYSQGCVMTIVRPDG